MRLTNLIATTSMIAGAALAAPAAAPAEGHQHHKDRRAIVTNTVMQKVTVGVTETQGAQQTGDSSPATQASPSSTQVAPTTSSQAAPTSSSQEAPSSTEAAPSSSSSEAAPTTSSTAAPSSSSASPSSSETPSSASSSSSAPSASSTGSSGSSGSGSAGSAGFRGITYTPYKSDGSCKSTSEVKSDLEQLDGYPVIRLYGTDCDQVANVFQGKSESQKVFLGIYYVDQISDSVKTLSQAVEKYGSWNDVVTVSVGNELVNDGQAVPSKVGEYVQEARSALKSAGYNGDVVSVDTFIAVVNNPDLCQHSDYMAVNAHAFFDQFTPAEKAGTWLLQQIQRVSEACDNEKKVVVVESGWPSKGQTYGQGVPSLSNQKAALEGISKSCGDDTYAFTAFNDMWKPDGAYGVEKWFGVLGN